MILLIFMNWHRQPRYFTNRLVNAYFPAFRAVLVSSGSFLFFLLQSFTTWKSTIVISIRNTTSRKQFLLIIGIMVAHLFKFQSMNDYSSVNRGFFSGTGTSGNEFLSFQFEKSISWKILERICREVWWKREELISEEALNVRWQKDDGSLRKKRIDFSYEKTTGILKREEQLLNFKKRCLTKVENFKKV